MKRLLSLVISAGVLALAACAAPTGSDPAPEVAKIKAACASDALIRPSVNALLAVPSLAKPADVIAVRAAQGVIDRVCAEPTVDKQQALAEATGQIIAAYAELKARRAAAAPE